MFVRVKERVSFPMSVDLFICGVTQKLQDGFHQKQLGGWETGQGRSHYIGLDLDNRADPGIIMSGDCWALLEVCASLSVSIVCILLFHNCEYFGWQSTTMK